MHILDSLRTDDHAPPGAAWQRRIVKLRLAGVVRQAISRPRRLRRLGLQGSGLAGRCRRLAVWQADRRAARWCPPGECLLAGSGLAGRCRRLAVWQADRRAARWCPPGECLLELVDGGCVGGAGDDFGERLRADVADGQPAGEDAWPDFAGRRDRHFAVAALAAQLRGVRRSVADTAADLPEVVGADLDDAEPFQQ